MPGGEITGGLDPLNKSTLSAEVKSTHIYPKNGVEYPKNGVEAPDRSELLPESDRVQLTKELQPNQSALPQSLTGNTELNHYIQIMRQSEAEGLLDTSGASLGGETTKISSSSFPGENFSYYA